ncbi:MAG: HAMP domain-containing sensor histidine kinase [Rikenellaceae bacterium]
MRHIKYHLILLISFLFCAGNAKAYTSDEVLVISSYGTNYQWSNSIIDGINSELKESNSNITIYPEYLSSERLAEANLWVDKINTILDKYRQTPPLAIVLISDEAWMAYRDADIKAFKDTPLLLCAVKPHSISIDKYTKNYESLSLDDFSPTAELMKSYNAVGVLREMNINSYIDLMIKVIPNIDQFALITDNRFYGVYVKLLFTQEISEKHSEYETTFFDARFINTDSLLNNIHHITKNTGVLLTSWLTGEQGFTYSQNYVYNEMSEVLKTPIFLTNDIGLYKGWFIGGYFNRSEFWGNEIGIMLKEIISGKQSSELSIITHKDDQCIINWDILKKFKLSESKFPKDTIYINHPISIFNKYKVETTFAITIFVIIVLFSIYILDRNIRLKKAQKLIMKSVEEVDNINQQLYNAKENLLVALEKAKDADRLKSSFVANMGQQIRNPLNAIVGFSNLISIMEDPKDREETSILLKQNSDTLFHLITSILDISQLESKSVTFCHEKTVLRGLCEDLVNAHRSLLSPDVTISFNPSEEPIEIVTDPQRLAEVLSCILNNAIKFTPKGSIEAGYFVYMDQWVEFYVKDTGIGIPEDKLAIIFDSFVKANPYIAGAGLGLTIAKNIVEIFGGEIGVTSEVNVGSRFWFRIKKQGN